jgi:multidrug efflux pump subunit AcrA (membrane-fusion protein)
MADRIERRHVAIAALAAAAMALASQAAAQVAAQDGASVDLAVTVTKAKQQCFTHTLQVTGVLVPRTEILVRPEREGLQIKQVLVEPGASVVSGQVLARLGAPDGRGDNTALQAPAAGVVSTVNAVIGTTASARAQPLFSIVKDGQVELLGESPVGDLARLAPEQPAKVEIVGVGGLSGKVRQISTAINPQTQLGVLRITVGRDSRLRVGAFGRATIDVGRSCAPAIPLSAVLYGQDGIVVQAVRDGRVETRRVTVGSIQGGQAEIREGLSEGDVVVTRAGAFLRDGDRVRPVAAGETVQN